MRRRRTRSRGRGAEVRQNHGSNPHIGESGHLPAQRLVPEPVAELEEHQPQVRLQRHARPPEPERRNAPGTARRTARRRARCRPAPTPPAAAGTPPEHRLPQRRLNVTRPPHQESLNRHSGLVHRSRGRPSPDDRHADESSIDLSGGSCLLSVLDPRRAGSTPADAYAEAVRAARPVAYARRGRVERPARRVPRAEPTRRDPPQGRVGQWAQVSVPGIPSCPCRSAGLGWADRLAVGRRVRLKGVPRRLMTKVAYRRAPQRVIRLG